MSRMDIGKFVSKFRQVADLLEELFGGINETPLVARAILGDIRPKRKYAKKLDPRAGYKYKPGTHWTQRPENKEKLMKMVRKSTRTSKSKRATNG